MVLTELGGECTSRPQRIAHNETSGYLRGSLTGVVSFIEGDVGGGGRFLVMGLECKGV